MWRTAKTLDEPPEHETEELPSSSTEKQNQDVATGGVGDPLLFGRLPVPTNAFQSKMADGLTTPTMQQRLGSFVAPVPALFRAGTLASGVGYGIATCLIGLRTSFLPSYQTETIPVNVLYASVYTGCFMAVVSNLRYQILQGLVEPILIDRWIFFGIAKEADGSTLGSKTQSHRLKIRMVSRSVLIFVVRWLNGLLGSVLAINGMRMFGLQRLKSG